MPATVRERSRSLPAFFEPDQFVLSAFIKFGTWDHDYKARLKPETRHWEQVLKPSQHEVKLYMKQKPEKFVEPTRHPLVDIKKLAQALPRCGRKTHQQGVQYTRQWIILQFSTRKRWLERVRNSELRKLDHEDYQFSSNTDINKMKDEAAERINAKFQGDAKIFLMELCWIGHTLVCEHLQVKLKPCSSQTSTAAARHNGVQADIMGHEFYEAATNVEDMLILTAPSLPADLIAPSLDVDMLTAPCVVTLAENQGHVVEVGETGFGSLTDTVDIDSIFEAPAFIPY